MTVRHIRTYGRTRARKIDLSIMTDNPHLYHIIPEDKICNQVLHLEIGFGNGENLLHRALKYSDILQIGVDVYKNGICKILKHIKKFSGNNIYLSNADARDFIADNPTLNYDHIYVMFPDPWHKKSEKKRQKKRLINADFLNTLLQRIKNNGCFIFASDHLDYYEAVKFFLHPFIQNGTFSILKETVNAYPNCFSENHFIQSNYEKKATNDRYYIVLQKSS